MQPNLDTRTKTETVNAVSVFFYFMYIIFLGFC